MPSALCVFDNCGTTNWAKQCLQYFGCSASEMAEKYKIDEDTIMELAFHRYLPRDEMVKFFDVIKQFNIRNIVNCCNPELCGRFERKRASMIEAGIDPKLVEPLCAYHGTKSENVGKIVSNGFLLSTLGNNTGNRGAYGAGIYCR